MEGELYAHRPRYFFIVDNADEYEPPTRSVVNEPTFSETPPSGLQTLETVRQYPISVWGDEHLRET